jgi:hypothetical protein
MLTINPASLAHSTKEVYRGKMIKQPFINVLITFFVLTLTPTPQVFGKKAQTFTDWEAFQSAVGTVTVIDFEDIALKGGQAGAVELTGNEFPWITLTPGEEDGLFVGIPDPSILGANDVNFFANDFFSTSEIAVFSPDLFNGTSVPHGKLVVDFGFHTGAVGAYFLDVERGISSIEAFDGQGGTGKSLAKVTLQYEGDNSQTFAGIVASGIRSAVIVMGYSRDGVGIDDLAFEAYPSLDLPSNVNLTSVKVEWDKGKIKIDGEVTFLESNSYPDMTGEVEVYVSDESMVKDSVIFDIKGRNYDMWEFENRHAIGVTRYKVHWRDTGTHKIAEISIEANFDQGPADSFDLTPTLALQITLGELVFPAVTIGWDDWTSVHDKNGNKFSQYMP